MRVTACVPAGATEFQARAGLPDDEALAVPVPAARVAEQGYRGLMGGRMVVTGVGNQLITFMPRIAPRASCCARSIAGKPRSEACAAEYVRCTADLQTRTNRIGD